MTLIRFSLNGEGSAKRLQQPPLPFVTGLWDNAVSHGDVTLLCELWHAPDTRRGNILSVVRPDVRRATGEAGSSRPRKTTASPGTVSARRVRPSRDSGRLSLRFISPKPALGPLAVAEPKEHTSFQIGFGMLGDVFVPIVLSGIYYVS